MGDAAVAPAPVRSDGESRGDEAIKAGKCALGELRCALQAYLVRAIRVNVCGPDKIIGEFPDCPIGIPNWRLRSRHLAVPPDPSERRDGFF